MPSPPPRDGPRRRASLAPEIDRIGRRQRGLITAGQLVSVGVGRSGRHWAQVTGRVTRVRPGVYLLAGVQPSWETMVLAAGPGAVASHVTAARLWDLFDGPAAATLAGGIHVITPVQRHHHGIVVHRHRLEPTERARRRSVPVTSAARTLLDLSSLLDPESLGRCTDEALRRGVVDLGQVRAVFDTHSGPGRRRLDPLRQVLAARVLGFDPGANDWEYRMDELWDALGLPPARRQYVIVTEGGRYRVDRAVVELRLAVEWVGTEFHGQRGRYSRDRIRISDLVQAGWDVIEVTPNWTPERLRRTVLAKVSERRRLLLDGAAG